VRTYLNLGLGLTSCKETWVEEPLHFRKNNKRAVLGPSFPHTLNYYSNIVIKIFFLFYKVYI
jgi:hypothetical protein